MDDFFKKKMNDEGLTFPFDVILLIIKHLSIEQQFQCQCLSKRFHHELSFEKWSRHPFWKGNYPYVTYILLRYRGQFLEETASWMQGGAGWYGCEKVTLDLLFRKPMIAQVDWHRLVANPAITLEDMDCYPNIDWGRLAYFMLRNPNIIPSDVFARYPELKATDWERAYMENPAAADYFLHHVIHTTPWKCWALHLHPRVTVDFIRLHSQYNWDYAELSRNPNLTFDFILQHKEKSWSWDSLSAHQCVTWDFYLAYPEFPWVKFRLCDNPNIPLDVFLAWRSPDGYNDWNPIVSDRVLELHPEVVWNYGWVSASPNISWSYVTRNMNKPWCWNSLAIYPRPNE